MHVIYDQFWAKFNDGLKKIQNSRFIAIFHILL